MLRPTSTALLSLACPLLGALLFPPEGRAQGVAPRAAAVLEALPADALGVLVCDDVARLREDFAASATGRLWADAGLAPVRAEIEGLVEEAMQTALEETTLDLAALAEMVSGPAVLSLVHLGPPPASAGDSGIPVSVVLALVVDAGERVDEFSDAIDAFLEFAGKQPNTVLKSEKIGDLDVALLADEQNEGSGARFGFVDSYFVFTLQVQDLERDDYAVIAEALAGGDTEGLLSVPAFRGLPAAQAAADVRMYCDTGAILRRSMEIGQQLREAEEGPGSVADFGAEEAESLGLFGLGPVSTTWDFGAAGSRSTFDLAFSSGGRVQDLLLAGVSAQAPRLEALVPADARSCVSLDVDFAGLFDAGIKWLMDEDPDEARELLASMDETAVEMGFHPREDLLGNMDGQLAFMDAKVPADEALSVETPGVEPSSPALLIGLSDGAAMRAALDSVVRANGMHAARERHEFEGFEYYTLPIFPGVALAYAVLDDLFVLAPSVSLVTDVLRRKASAELPSMGNRKDVQAALASLPGQRTGTQYSDQAAAMRAMQAALLGMEDAMQQMGGVDLEELGPWSGLLEAVDSIDPSLFDKYFGGKLGVNTMTLDSTGLHGAGLGP